MSETQQTTEATREIVAETMVGELMKITLDELKLIDKPWQTLSYFQQDDIISRVQNQVHDAVRQAVQILGSGGMVRVPVQLESLTVKDGIKGVISVARTDEHRHALMDAQGMLCTLVLADTARILDAPHKHKAEKDQRELPLEEASTAAAELDRNARESGNVVVLADGDGTVIAEFGKAA